jgi:mannose-6-phosphate isomerase-like protein (cupin superfamily)
MPIALEGGCFVTALREGKPDQQAGIRIWRHVHRGTGATAISLRVLEFAPGTSPAVRTPRCDEVLYVLEGEATLIIDGEKSRIGCDVGVYLGPGTVFTVENSGPFPLTVVSSQCPDPGTSLDVVRGLSAAPSGSKSRPAPVVALDDTLREVTSDRWYRVLVDKQLGCSETTQFVGGIPPGRAPDHFHHYEEVLCILSGSGRMWAGQSNAPIQPGSCIFLPRGQVHCVENTGGGELRLLGVFHPAGSPAVRYEAG